MSKKLQIPYQFENITIHFEFDGENMMVNATEMAKFFGKKVEGFTRTQQTEDFINACLKIRNSHFPNRKDLIVSRPKSGTWMHRYLAAKFAAWLSPEFEVWVYDRIDYILYGKYEQNENSLKESAERKHEAQKIREKFQEEFPDEYGKLMALEAEGKRLARQRNKRNKEQINLFLGSISDN